MGNTLLQYYHCVGEFAKRCLVEMVCCERVVSVDVTVVLLKFRPRQFLLNVPKLF